MERELELLEEAFAEGRMDQAVSVANHLVGLGPEGEHIANVSFARIEAARGNLDGAIEQLSALTARFPDDPLPLGHLAATLHLAGDEEKAL